jgi:hypothetical protein
VGGGTLRWGRIAASLIGVIGVIALIRFIILMVILVLRQFFFFVGLSVFTSQRLRGFKWGISHGPRLCFYKDQSRRTHCLPF